jgi:metal-sulfur cluster biosynthetic enzyme
MSCRVANLKAQTMTADAASPVYVEDLTVDVDLTAWHTDPIGDEGRHQHTWNIALSYVGEPFRDQRALRKSLEVFLEPYQGTDLPWWSAEDIGRAVLTLGTADPHTCVVSRPGYSVTVRRRP